MDPILLKILVAAVVAFVISAVIGKFLVPALRRWKAGQSIKEDGPTWHMSKQGTPTMGGLMFILATIIVVLVVNGPAILSGDWTSVIVLVFALVFGAIGFLDDYAKIKKKENTGLTAGQKFLLQLAAAILFIVLLRKCGILSPNLYVPFFGVELHLPWVVYLIFAVLVITGTVNAVNITDGLDGLSSSVTLPVCAFFAAAFGWAWVKWQQSGTAGMAVFAAALFGGLVGFLVYNHYPAKVFMGDTGSLFLGGAVCGMAFALDLPLILILVGIIYIIETLSDIIQVTYFKATHGKRIFRMAPLHHHLEMGGWNEKKVVFVFASISLVFCILAFFGVMGRFPAL
ncbi:phospho-N-acetylmuramoyl-pentapeptide-transferase [Evtepia sp.]|jgi:phospho-N-acetylmuramoyl-pentapeptide-transferase|uniref:phospho-N-acetylmuramoyl-pentapeptide- transferase n=1 Tax=Evtepia sp. TaxID=2773933 RepID=UPI00270889D1|nr:phospho-N-acetylmuramoyl-pentapeptide-transferase [Evtepia sp.]MDO5595219.1 phospho-N-acetylmuramoyl-pentapeptide-transferase [Bacillota bacterium]MEE0256833.1 phospho-N-acetylmuramoyl-pentapeptide-transferase [Evtepia sp.]